MKRFYLPTELHHGAGSIDLLRNYLSSEKKVGIVTDPGMITVGLDKPVTNLLNDIGVSVIIYDGIQPNPRAQSIMEAVNLFAAEKVTSIIALGGGSSIDAAKMVALVMGNEGTLDDYLWDGREIENPVIPLYVIPTTSGTGSEVSRIAVILDRDAKKGINSDRLFPKAAFLDPAMIASLPPHLTAFTGCDALTHALEALICTKATPVTDSLAMEAIRRIITFLPKAYANGDDLLAREEVAVAASMAGIAMDQAGLGFVHSVSSPICAHFDLAHGLTNGILLPYGLHFNAVVAQDKLALLSSLFMIDTSHKTNLDLTYEVIGRIEQFLEIMEVPKTIEGISVTEAELEMFAKDAVGQFMMRANPRKPRVCDCQDVLRTVLCCSCE